MWEYLALFWLLPLKQTKLFSLEIGIEIKAPLSKARYCSNIYFNLACLTRVLKQRLDIWIQIYIDCMCHLDGKTRSILTSSPYVCSYLWNFVSREKLYLIALDIEKIQFLHGRPWISPWIKSISNELDTTIHVISSQLSGHCDVINNRLWRHQQNDNRTSETRGRCVKSFVLSSLMDSLCRVGNKIMYVLSWGTVSALTRGLVWYLFPSLLRNSGNKHQNNPLVSTETVRRHSITYIILYLNLWVHASIKSY